jgi:hypothetical protein
MFFKTAALCLFFMLSATSLYADTTVDITNWATHPAIIEVMEIVNDIEAQIVNGVLISNGMEQEYENPDTDVFREVFADINGTVRKLVRSAGSEDSAVTFSFYYDSEGILRFAYILGGAVNGTQIQHRIFFDSSGARIWEIQELTEGPGYTFPTVWPDADIVYNPGNQSLNQ